MMFSKVFQTFSARLAIASVSTAALTLGVAGAGQAVQFTLTGEASGADSGLDAVLGNLSSLTNQEQITTIQNTVNGVNSVQTVEVGGNNFFSFEFRSPTVGAFVKSIAINLRGSGDPDAAFDNQEGFGAFDTNPEVSQTEGTLQKSDITFSPDPVLRNDNNQPNPTSELLISFLDNTFTSGSLFRFGVDTNAVGEDVVTEVGLLDGITNDNTETFNDAGGDFGKAGVTFLATIMAGGQVFEQKATFQTINDFRSVATASFAQTPPVTDVPEPFTILGSAAALGFGARLKRKRDRQKAKVA